MSIGSEVAWEARDLAGPSGAGGVALASCKHNMKHITKISKGVHSSSTRFGKLISVLANNMEAKWRMNVGKG